MLCRGWTDQVALLCSEWLVSPWPASVWLGEVLLLLCRLSSSPAPPPAPSPSLPQLLPAQVSRYYIQPRKRWRFYRLPYTIAFNLTEKLKESGSK